MTEAGELGPQYAGDNAFTAQMRLHQSWWRRDRLAVPPGTDQRGNVYGNYLDVDAAERGLNFLTPSIAAYAAERISSGPGVEEFRCTRNLLSSQPMAFNLFGPLRDDPALAQRLLDPLLPGGVTEAAVRVEWTPDRTTHLDDRTSCDAVAHIRDRNGHPTIVAFETKLTEPFSQQHYDPPRYREVARRSEVWTDPEDLSLADTKWNQLWRNQLLVEAVRQQPDADAGLRALSVVVHHPGDQRCRDSIDGYRRHLSPAGSATFLDLPLDAIVEAWAPLVSGTSHEGWLRDFEDRYLRLAG